MDWRCGSSDKVAALQVQSTEFKPHSHQKKKKKEEGRSSQTWARQCQAPDSLLLK
jgi:hypothetical protein